MTNEPRNPGNNPRNHQNRKPQGRPQAPKAVEMLPDPTILESYDYVVEGAAEQILRMFEAEQKHRHAWEVQALKAYTVSSIFGQVLGFIIAIAVFGSAAVIGLRGDSSIAAFIWVFGMSIIMMSGLVWTYAKSMGQRPLFGRPTFRRHFRAESADEGGSGGNAD
ncbi:MAG: DUF2335 domain-containing protein [Alphaproteobacteria bacterium]|nr:DUF2335 domain-containing protein [Alphaproteobacteria bacterium]